MITEEIVEALENFQADAEKHSVEIKQDRTEYLRGIEDTIEFLKDLET